MAFFIAKRLRSNVRELEGALNRVIANANFTGRAITIDFVREALRDLLALQEKLVTIDNIQKTVAEYYKIKVADLLSSGVRDPLPARARWRWRWRRTHQPQPAGNRRCVWWPRPYHGVARLPED